MERNGNPSPVFDCNRQTEFRVTLRPATGGINGEITPSTGGINGEITPPNGEIKLKNGEMQIWDAISKNPGIKRDRLQMLTGIPLRTIDRIVKRLTAVQKIEYRGSKRTGGWYVRT